MTHADVRELLPAYALDALTLDEAREVEAHLRTCAECPSDLEALRRVAADLGGAVPMVTPPAVLRAMILDAVRPRTPLITFPRRWALTFGAAAAALVILLAGTGVVLERDLTGLRERLAAQEQVLALLANPSTKTTSLTGTVRANVRFLYDPARKQGALVVTDLRDPGAEFIYQLWLVAGQQPESAGVFRPAPGRAIIVPVAADFTRYQVVAISVERAPRGALRPTTTPILAGTI